MSESETLLDMIDSAVVEHGGDLGGWTRREGDALQLFDGRVTLRAEVREGVQGGGDGMVHVHALAALHEHDDEVLEACILGMGDDRKSALGQAAGIWLTAVAGPIRSFLDGKPACMTCQANVEGGDLSEGYCAGGFGLPPGLRAYVGPSISRGLPDRTADLLPDEAMPWFRFAAESAAPRRVHLAKSTVIHHGEQGWRRELEIDGHDVSLCDPDWPARKLGARAGFGYATRFAVFEFPRNSQTLAQRAKLEEAILHYAKNASRCEDVNDLIREMVLKGAPVGLVFEVVSFTRIVFGRILFEPLGVKYPSTIIRARRDGQVQEGVPLMGIPAYSRAMALAVRILETMPEPEFRAIALASTESDVVLQAIQAAGGAANLSGLAIYPSIEPDPGAPQEAIDAANAVLDAMVERERRARKKKPWWKFW